MQFFHSESQSAGVETQVESGSSLTFNFPVGFFKHLENIFPFQFLKAQRLIRQKAGGGGNFDLEITFRAGDNGPFNQIFQLPDVSGPGIAL